ncbi:hypothetical protein [Polycladidibacter stylochi]|uniref:hypothetical protein n=1 Tax=Polycladidibacter stylochi TaxID=1807766 RepID=UPI00082D2287|nr:hypothetical protein [Pseudovibrio stylochi]
MLYATMAFFAILLLAVIVFSMTPQFQYGQQWLFVLILLPVIFQLYKARTVLFTHLRSHWLQWAVVIFVMSSLLLPTTFNVCSLGRTANTTGTSFSCFQWPFKKVVNLPYRKQFIGGYPQAKETTQMSRLGRIALYSNAQKLLWKIKERPSEALIRSCSLSSGEKAFNAIVN